MSNGKPDSKPEAGRAKIQVQRLVMRVGTDDYDYCKAYWWQFWKVRIGFFTGHLKDVWIIGVEKVPNYGWRACCGPFQICYYRYA